MKRLSSAIILLIVFSCFFFYACPKKNPFAPEQSKPRAALEILIREFEIDMTNWYQGFNHIWINFLVKIADAVLVGANEITVTADMYLGNKHKSTETQNGGVYRDGEYSTFLFNLQIWGPDYKVDKLTIVVKGIDNNGYSIDEKVHLNISWDESSPILIR